MNDYLKELSQEELFVLIKYRCDKERKTHLQFLYKRTFYDKNELINSCKRIISYLRYHNTTIYIEEVFSILTKLEKDDVKYFYNQYYSIEAIALVLVTEILDYYKAKYDEEILLKLYDVDKACYMDMKIAINRYLSSNYWNKN